MDAVKFYGETPIHKILLKLAPPVMFAQLIQALYNIVDSLFVGRFSQSGLTALSIIYPLQLLMIALAVIRTVLLFVPLGYLFSRFGLDYFWLTFPVTEVITTTVGVILYRGFLKKQEPERVAP